MRLALVAGALSVALIPALAFAQSATQFRAQLSGSNEVPAVTTNATGTFNATLNPTANTLEWTLSVPNINDATAAHLHSGAAGVNGPVVVPLFNAPTGGPVDSINSSGTARVADLTGPFAGNWDAFEAALNAGTVYVNVHTTANPDGEIRAQVTTQQGTATPTPTGTATATATATPKSTATASPTATAKASPTATATATSTGTPRSTATAVPSAPQSGTGGYLEQGNGVWVTLVLALGGAALAGVGMQIISRRR